jgi:hypothetical protein
MDMKFPDGLFSPTKTVYIGYVVLAALKVFSVSLTQFLVVSGILWAFEIVHNDFLRLKLNKWGER